MAKIKEKDIPVTIKVQDTKFKSSENLHAFVVDSNSKIVETAQFKGLEATLKSKKEMLQGAAKIYIAQGIPKEFKNKANERMLLKGGAYNLVKNFSGNILNVQSLPIGILNPWFWNNCLITGHVNKEFYIDGAWKNLPLCNMRVHICEVETELVWPYIPIYYRRIPDWVINEISQKIKNIGTVVPPIPGPGPDPGPLSGVQIKRNLLLNDLPRTKSFSADVQLNKSDPLPDHIFQAMTSNNLNSVRKALADYHDLLYPYLCMWPVYWPWIYTYDEETIVYTDCDGHFEMWENTLTEDGPLNIYIWVEACINGIWVTVYKPALPCNTWWDYACNTDINIQVTDTRVGPCDCGTVGPADAVWFRSIGWSASALHIEQDIASTIPLQGAILKNGGCTDIIDGQKISPFGSGLTLKLFCGANIFNAGVTHYRWKKTMVTDANQNPVAGSPSIILGNVSRPYLVKLSATHYETHYVLLGAEGTGSDLAYRIPHHDVTVEPNLQDPADYGRSPEWTYMFFDSAYIDSNSLTDGIFKFELELLKQQANGSFTLIRVAKETFQVSEYGNIGNSQNAPDGYLNIYSGNHALADSYKMNVRIDNATCVADIHDAVLNETLAPSGPCGFIIYSHTGQHVHISFEASHPRNFATFSFGIVKGNNTQPTGINPSGYVISSVGGFTLSGVVFNDDFTVLELLNGCINQAAFSENLNVWCLATDGTYRLSSIESKYYKYDVNAFALSNT